MANRAQGAFEYILLLAGILLIVILTIVILRGSVLAQANAGISNGVNTFLQLTNVPPIDGLLFLAHFNGNLLSHKGEAPNSTGNVTFTGGRFGLGANVTGPANLSYRTSGNFNRPEGTVGAWVRFDTAVAGTIRRMFHTAVTGAANNSFTFLMSGASLVFQLFDANGSGRIVLVSVPDVPGEWHHYAASWKNSTGSMRLYRDGLLVNSTTLAVWDVNETAVNFHVGHRFTDGTTGTPIEHVNGTIDEFVIYGRQLTDDEVKRLGQTTIEVPA